MYPIIIIQYQRPKTNIENKINSDRITKQVNYVCMYPIIIIKYQRLKKKIDKKTELILIR